MYFVCFYNPTFNKVFLRKRFDCLRLAYKYARCFIKKVDCVDISIWEHKEDGVYCHLAHFCRIHE